MAFAIPIAIAVGGKIAAHYAAKRAAKAAQERAQTRSPEELAALGGATGAAGQLGQQGSQLFQQGQQAFSAGSPGLDQASNYYATLLGGNRAAQAQATAAPRAAIGDIYRGASRGLERGGLRGAVRDTAQGELAREQAGRLAGLTTGVQPMAAEGLAGISGQRMSLGLQAQGTGAQVTQAGGNLYSTLLGAGQQNRQNAVNIGTQAGQSAGAAVGQLAAAAGGAYSAYRGGSFAGGAGGGALASSPITGVDSRTLSGAPGYTGIQNPYVAPGGGNATWLRQLQSPYRAGYRGSGGFAGVPYGSF